MFQNIKKFLVIFGVSIFLFTVIAPLSGVFSKHLKYRKPYASTLTLPSPVKDTTEEDEEADEDCGEDCGEECSADEWDCGDWNACTDGKQSRKCSISFDCEEADTASPATSQKCEVKEVAPPPEPPPPPPEPTCKEDKWDCGSWGTCTDGKQSRKCKIVDDCKEASTPSPTTSQKCEVKEITPPPTPEPTPPPEPKQPEPTPLPPPTKETDNKAHEAARLEAEKKEAARKAAEEAKRLEEERKEAERKAAEELKMKEEEAKRLEEERKAAEQEALQKEQERITRAAQEAERAQEQLKQVVVETPAFKEIFITPPVVTAPAVNFDALKKAAGIDPKKADSELIKKEVEISVVKKKALVEEKGEVEAEKIVQHEIKKVREERKREIIRKASRTKKIVDSKQGVKERGVSDEVAVLYGFRPEEQIAQKEKEQFSSPVEKKLFGVPSTKTIDQIKKSTLGLTHGSKIGEKGAALLATCPTKNAAFELHAIDAKGVDRSVAKQTCSENNKLVFSVPALPSGNYAFKVKPVSSSPMSWFFPSFASTLNAGVSEESDPVLVSVVSDPGVPEPVVESIEGVNVAGLRDIQITAGTDGKITVSGSSDITTMVIGTFSSAVFTSAMLADIDTGRFEVISPRALEAGTHEVVIYATRPEESTQSVPVKLRFNLIGVAKAEAPAKIEIVNPEAPPVISHPSAAAAEKKFPLVPVLAFGGLAVLLIGIGIFLKKNKKSAS